jgi:hypothetical protein
MTQSAPIGRRGSRLTFLPKVAKAASFVLIVLAGSARSEEFGRIRDALDPAVAPRPPATAPIPDAIEAQPVADAASQSLPVITPRTAREPATAEVGVSIEITPGPIAAATTNPTDIVITPGGSIELKNTRLPALAVNPVEQASFGNTPLHPEFGPCVAEGRVALEFNLKLLEKGHEILSAIPGYTAKFSKQERVGVKLGDENEIVLKLRHAPFSVYMKWETGDKGREVLFVEGENDGQMIAHAGGWKARLIPALKLDPIGAMAMSEARHPVTEAGLLNMVRIGIDFRRRDLQNADRISCQMFHAHVLDDRDCYVFVINYADPECSPEYRRTILFVDRHLSLTVAAKNYGWPTAEQIDLTGAELDEVTLIENYAYSEIEIQPSFTALDFDRKNSEYKFKR